MQGMENHKYLYSLVSTVPVLGHGVRVQGEAAGALWAEQPPLWPVGRLRQLGLVYVGRMPLADKVHRAVLFAFCRPIA